MTTARNEEGSDLAGLHKPAPAVAGKGGKVGGGAFASLGLAPNLCKAIMKMGYKQPTPVQRRTIPLLLTGKDVIGMARTGSGKTAAFVLPLLQNLRVHSAKTGVRALILAPSRELALQTLKFTQKMAKFTDLRVAALIGGDGLEEQFASMAANPDIVVATPGRLLHVCVEAGISLKTVSVVIWDEADRLMEDSSMGEQLKDIMARCPASRQTALFSATMPQALADFTRTGLTDAVLIRLDAESKLSPDLTTVFLSVKSEERDAHLMRILSKESRKISSSNGKQKNPLTVIFAATKHHVEYLQELLTSMRLPCTYIYGSLDQTARESAIDSFRSGRKNILIVTDVASRGIDIPLLDVVINYDFPASSKLFVHRVGRVARAGRAGIAYSFVAPDELPYLFDLQLYLERPVKLVAPGVANSSDIVLLGSLRQSDIDEETERLRSLHSYHGSLSSLRQVANNAYKLYKKSRISASAESHRRAKDLIGSSTLVPPHPHFYGQAEIGEEADSFQMLSALKAFKPKQSFLEMTNAQAMRTAPSENGKKKRTAGQSAAVETVSKSYKDESNYMDYKPAQGSGQLSFGRVAADSIFDINIKKDDLLKTGMMLSSKLKKQRASAGKDVKMMKTEFGTSIPASYKAGTYEKWCSRTRLTIQKPGESESADVTGRAKSIINDKATKRKWRKPITKGAAKKKPARK